MHETQGPGQTFSNRTPVYRKQDWHVTAIVTRPEAPLETAEQPLSDQFRQKADVPSHVDYLDMEVAGEKRDLSCQVLSLLRKWGDLKVFKYVQQVLSHSLTRASAYWKRELKRLKAIVIFLRHLLTRATLHQSGPGHLNSCICYECRDKTVEAAHCVIHYKK